MDRETFERGLDDNPTNWDLRLVYADWLEDHGYTDEARCQRWMAGNKKRARYAKGFYKWYRLSSYAYVAFDEESDIVDDVYDNMTGRCDDVNDDIKEYDTRQQSEDALCAALTKVQPCPV